MEDGTQKTISELFILLKDKKVEFHHGNMIIGFKVKSEDQLKEQFFGMYYGFFYDGNFIMNYLDHDERDDYRKILKEWIEVNIDIFLIYFDVFPVDNIAYNYNVYEKSQSYEERVKRCNMFLHNNKDKLSETFKQTYIDYRKEYAREDFKF